MIKHALSTMAMITMLGSAGNVAAHDSALLQDLVARHKTLESQVKKLTAEGIALKAESGRLKADVETKQDAIYCLYQVGHDLYVDGCNLHVQDGTGTSASDTAPNGLGNLIVGYNEDHPWAGSEKTGSHNVIVGAGHTYTDTSGLVTGFRNIITGKSAAVIGGFDNVASGPWSTVSGGNANRASGFGSTVSGGYDNDASGFGSTVSAGVFNEASANWSTVSGGEDNVASGHSSSVSGGVENEASGDYSSVSGGFGNVADAAHEILP